MVVSVELQGEVLGPKIQDEADPTVGPLKLELL